MRSVLTVSLTSLLFLTGIRAFDTPINCSGHERQCGDHKLEVQGSEHHSVNITNSENHHEGLRGMRCGTALYTLSNLKDAGSQACKFLKENRKTWGFIRYPLPYQPSLEEITNPLSSKDEKVDGPFFLYPILKGGKIYKFGLAGDFRIIVNRECQVAGALIKLNSRTECPGKRCWNPFRFQHLIYKSCDLDY